MKKILSVILLCALVLSVFTACSGENTPAALKAFDKEVSSEKPTNKTVAQNGKYTLEFDENTCGITLTDSQSGKSWGTSPPESDKVRLDKWGDPITRHPRVNFRFIYRVRFSRNGEYRNGYFKNGRAERGKNCLQGIGKRNKG